MQPKSYASSGMFFLLLLLSLPISAFAAHPLTTDDTGTVGTSRFQAESSLELAWDREGGTKNVNRTLGLAVTGGLADTVDLVLSIPYSWQSITANDSTVRDNNGFNDVTVALKWRFLEAGNTSMALKPSVSFPTGSYDRGLGAGRASFGATLISTIELKPVAIHVNLGYNHQKYTDAAREGAREDMLNLSMAASLGLTSSLQVAAEIGAATNSNRSSSIWPLFMSGGVIYTVYDGLDLDLGAKGGLNGPETDIALLAGVTARF